jgi:hypothetical protein
VLEANVVVVTVVVIRGPRSPTRRPVDPSTRYRDPMPARSGASTDSAHSPRRSPRTCIVNTTLSCDSLTRSRAWRWQWELAITIVPSTRASSIAIDLHPMLHAEIEATTHIVVSSRRTLAMVP